MIHAESKESAQKVTAWVSKCGHAHVAVLLKSSLDGHGPLRSIVIFKRRILMLAVLVSWQVLSFVSAQSPAAPAGAQGEHRKTSEPYTGDLSIFDSPGRDDRLQVNRVMDILGITAGKTVADIGAGSGWFTVRAARRVGEGGVVYAADINPESICYIRDRARKQQ